MKPMRLLLLASGVLVAAAGAASADPALTLAQGDIFTDEVGSVIAVSIVNGGTAPINTAVVTCAFSAGGRPLGSASTTIYDILPGAKGQDQVHFMGARAAAATCAISSTTAGSN